MISFFKRSFGFFILSIIGFFTPGPLYTTIASRPLKRSYLRLLQGFVGLGLYTAVLIHPLTPIFIFTVFLALTPLIMMSVAVDPFVSWLRGDDENPWHTFARYMSQGMWSIIIAVQPFLIALMAILIFKPEFMGVFAGNDIENAQSIEDIAMFLIFSLFLTVHFVYSQIKATERKHHKFASSIIFTGVYLVLPFVTVLVKSIS